MKIFKGILTGIGSIAILIMFIYAGSDVMQSPPDNLKVMINHNDETYISPECLQSSNDYDSEEYEVSSFSHAATELNYSSDSRCTDNSLWPSRNQLWDLVGTKLGFLKPLGWKWDTEGNWNEDVF